MLAKNETYGSFAEQHTGNTIDRLHELVGKVCDAREALDVEPMSQRDRLLGLHRVLTGNALETMTKKNQDYASDADPYRNFRTFGTLGVLVRMSDKLARLRTFEERGVFSVADESLRDTVEDLINYAVIYYAMAQEQK